MIKTILSAIVAVGIGASPVLAAEGNGNPFPFHADPIGVRMTAPSRVVADTGSAAFPNMRGRAGSNLPSLAGDTLPVDGSEGIVQTANSLPVGAEEGTVAFAQAKSMQNWMIAHSGQAAPAYAAATVAVHPGS